MLAITRKQAIKKLLQEQKSVTISNLSERLNVTKETIRRDLRAMEKDQELIRTHGGAYILEGVQNDLDVTTRQALRITEKEIIAQKCDALIQPSDIIFLDSSTTSWYIARKIVNRKLTVVTTSLEIANILSRSSTVHLFLTGGGFSARTKGFTGNGTVRSLQQYFFDKAFVSCRSVCMEFGVTDINEDSAMLYKIALQHAHQKFLVVDHTKLDKTSFSAVIPLEKMDAIITDCEFSSEWKEWLTKNSVQYY